MLLTESTNVSKFDAWQNAAIEAFEIENSDAVVVDEANNMMTINYDVEGNTFNVVIDLNKMLITVKYSDPEDKTKIYTSVYKIPSEDTVEDFIRAIANVLFWGNPEGENLLNDNELT